MSSIEDLKSVDLLLKSGLAVKPKFMPYALSSDRSQQQTPATVVRQCLKNLI